jgi:hypothetical protein
MFPTRFFKIIVQQRQIDAICGHLYSRDAICGHLKELDAKFSVIHSIAEDIDNRCQPQQAHFDYDPDSVNQYLTSKLSGNIRTIV